LQEENLTTRRCRKADTKPGYDCYEFNDFVQYPDFSWPPGLQSEAHLFQSSPIETCQFEPGLYSDFYNPSLDVQWTTLQTHAASSFQAHEAQNPLVLDNRSLPIGGDNTVFKYYDVSPHQRQDLAATPNAVGLQHHGDFLQLEFDNVTTSVLPELIESRFWPLLGTNPIFPEPSLAHGDNWSSSPTSVGTTTGISSSEGLGASSPETFIPSCDPSSIETPVNEIVCQAHGCAKICTSTRAYSKHISAVHKKQHVCQIEGCSFRSGFRADLHRHNKDVHLKQRDLMCSFPACGRYFGRKDNLQRHEKSVHGI